MRILKTWTYSDYNKSIKESLFTDYINKSLPIIKSYAGFISEIENKILDLERQSDSLLSDSKAKLMDINREYLEYIKDCMVDLEEYKIQSTTYLDLDSFDPYDSYIILREYYEFDVSKYVIFKDVMEKINDYIGKYSYNVYFSAGPTRYRNLDISYDGTKTLANLDIYINRAIDNGKTFKVFAHFEFRAVNERNNNDIKAIKNLNESYSTNNLKKEDIEYLFVDFIDDGGKVYFEDNLKTIDILSYVDEDIISGKSFLEIARNNGRIRTFKAFSITLLNVEKNITKSSILFVNEFLENYGLEFNYIRNFKENYNIYTNNLDNLDVDSTIIEIVYRKNK